MNSWPFLAGQDHKARHGSVARGTDYSATAHELAKMLHKKDWQERPGESLSCLKCLLFERWSPSRFRALPKVLAEAK